MTAVPTMPTMLTMVRWWSASVACGRECPSLLLHGSPTHSLMPIHSFCLHATSHCLDAAFIPPSICLRTPIIFQLPSHHSVQNYVHFLCICCVLAAYEALFTTVTVQVLQARPHQHSGSKKKHSGNIVILEREEQKGSILQPPPLLSIENN